ncbi:hypothetical protein AAV98_16905 [Bacillus sp. CHD6a]|nr:hypothetical protein AAV98_16905 [Bacillus sp. CHD6a]
MIISLAVEIWINSLLISANGFAFLGADVSLLGYVCGVSRLPLPPTGVSCLALQLTGKIGMNEHIPIIPLTILSNNFPLTREKT